MFELKGKVALITGSTKGLGYDMAKAVAAQGADVVIVSRHMDECEKVAGELGKEYGVTAYPHVCDVSKTESVQTLVADVVAKFGRIDILVNNAGIAITKKIQFITDEEWDKVLDVNLKGVFIVSREVGNQMIKQNSGSIVNVASEAGLKAENGIMPYCASKAGVIQMTRCCAYEWARYNIRVNAVAPAYVETDINKDVIHNEKFSAGILGRTPMRRFGVPKEVAAAVVFLASDEASYITGETVVIDGGMNVQ